MRILVTGVRGFIGGSLARAASRLGHEVIGLARASHEHHTLGVDVVVAHDQRRAMELISDFDPQGILHAAGTASVSRSIEHPRNDFHDSVLPWLDLLEAVRRSKRRPVLLLPSSAAVYGAPDDLPVSETAATRPISPYGFHKMIDETMAEEYAKCFGLEIVVLRLFSVFGPLQRRLLIWEIFDQLAGPGEQVLLQGTGRERRDFLHIDDVVEAMLGLLSKREGLAASGRVEILNLGSGEDLSVLEVAELMRAIVGCDKRIVCRGADRPGDPGAWRADVTRLCGRLAPWRPRSSRLSLPECVAAWRQSGV